jgi:hypothetical protein
LGPVAAIGLVSRDEDVTAVSGADHVLNGVFKIRHILVERLPETLFVNIHKIERVKNVGNETPCLPGSIQEFLRRPL